MKRDSLPAEALAKDRAAALRLTPVSRETGDRIDGLVDLLLRWRQTINLIAPSTVAHVWTRHVADSLQLLAHADGARNWLDLGSGAGFPGLVIACTLPERPNTSVHLVESDSRKAAFLREAARVLKLPAIIHAQRIESLHNGPERDLRVDVVTARAVAPLSDLLGYALPWIESGAKALFPKGRDGEAELTEAAKDWTFEATTFPSLLEPGGRIFRIERAERRVL